MGYYIDLEKWSIDNFKEWVKTSDLIPSWMTLRENIDFLKTIKGLGIVNLHQLREVLKNKSKIQEFATKSDLPNDYLAVLRRVIQGFHPKPNKVEDFPEIKVEVIEKLKKLSIKNTIQLYDRTRTQLKRKELATQANIDDSEVLKLWKFADLSRIKWVNHTFAFMLIEAGYDSTEKVASADSMEMYNAIKKVNESWSFYRGNIGANDMKRCIESAQMLTNQWLQ